VAAKGRAIKNIKMQFRNFMGPALSLGYNLCGSS
jgi:hypothetical protein